MIPLLSEEIHPGSVRCKYPLCPHYAVIRVRLPDESIDQYLCGSHHKVIVYLLDSFVKPLIRTIERKGLTKPSNPAHKGQAPLIRAVSPSHEKSLQDLAAENNPFERGGSVLDEMFDGDSKDRRNED